MIHETPAILDFLNSVMENKKYYFIIYLFCIRTECKMGCHFIACCFNVCLHRKLTSKAIKKETCYYINTINL